MVPYGLALDVVIRGVDLISDVLPFGRRMAMLMLLRMQSDMQRIAAVHTMP